jgi:hypothetical protein
MGNQSAIIQLAICFVCKPRLRTAFGRENCGLRSLRYAGGVTTFVSSAYPNEVTIMIRSFAVSILLREYIFQLDLQPAQDRLQLAQSNVVFAPFDTVEGGV